MKWLLCELGFEHKWEYEWEDAYSLALGPAQLEYKECKRCGKRIPTGKDRPIDDE